MNIHDNLKAKLAAAKENEQLHKKAYLKKTRELLDVETAFISAKESTLKAADELYVYEVTYVGENSLAEHRDQQVEDFRSRMAECMKRIENEKPLKLYSISDLDTE